MRPASPRATGGAFPAQGCRFARRATLAAGSGPAGAGPRSAACGATEGPALLHGLSLLYVGGRASQIARLRALTENSTATLLHHDGGVEASGGLLPGLISRADAVLFPVDCVSHSAVGIVKNLCRQAGKPYVPLRSAGIASFLAALRHPAITMLAQTQPAM